MAGALSLFESALQHDATSMRAAMNRAIVLHNMNRRSESDALWPQLLKRCVGDARLEGMCYYHLGASLSEAQRFDEAVATLSEGVAAMQRSAVQPGFETATSVVRGRLYCALGYSLASLKRLDEAEQAWLAGVEQSPNIQDNIVSLAHFYFNESRYDEALQWYDRLLKLQPNSLRFLMDYALALASLHDRASELTDAYEKCLKVSRLNL